MEHVDLLSISGLLLMLFLGMRHALEADHVATVDGMTFDALERRPPFAPWVGTAFALGHGGVVAVVAIATGMLGQRLMLGGWADTLVELFPIALLIVVGTLNWRALLRTEEDFRL